MTTTQTAFTWMFIGLTYITGALVGKYGGLGSEIVMIPAALGVLIGGMIDFIEVFTSSK